MNSPEFYEAIPTDYTNTRKRHVASNSFSNYDYGHQDLVNNSMLIILLIWNVCNIIVNDNFVSTKHQVTSYFYFYRQMEPDVFDKQPDDWQGKGMNIIVLG